MSERAVALTDLADAAMERREQTVVQPVGGMQTLDGFFLAARREAAIAIGFDAATFDGFHFYDLDFTYRAHAAGLKLAVTTEVCALHRSLGNFGEDWRRYTQHDFVRQLARGTLPEASFRRYLGQDYLFLVHFAEPGDVGEEHRPDRSRQGRRRLLGKSMVCRPRARQV